MAKTCGQGDKGHLRGIHTSSEAVLVAKAHKYCAALSIDHLRQPAWVKVRFNVIRIASLHKPLCATSINSAFCRAAQQLAQAPLNIDVYADMRMLSLFNPDLENCTPATVQNLSAAADAADDWQKIRCHRMSLDICDMTDTLGNTNSVSSCLL
ncbi:MAG: hypothetical protein ACRCV9_00935 [Burkholderiaceae bacterium]